MKALRNSSGMVLVVTLMVLAIITALVVEFAYGVFVSTNALYNWQTSQKLSIIAKSAIGLASRAIAQNDTAFSYTYPAVVVIARQNPLEGFDGEVLIRIESENAKFNLNTLVFPNGSVNSNAYNAFERLLKAMNLGPSIADRIVNWISPRTNPDTAQFGTDPEVKLKHAPFDSIDELALVPGIDSGTFGKLLPYVTIYGNGTININGAEEPVLMSLSDSVDRDMAERVVKYRGNSPFENVSDIMKVAGFEKTGASLMGLITVKGNFFRVVATITAGGIKNITESVLQVSGSRSIIQYWKEV